MSWNSDFLWQQLVEYSCLLVFSGTVGQFRRTPSFSSLSSVLALRELSKIVGTVLFGTGTICIFNALQNYYIDAFTRYAASAIAAGVLFRSFIEAVFPLFGGDIFNAIGYGWGCAILAALGIILLPMPSLIMKYGKRVREKFPIKLD